MTQRHLYGKEIGSFVKILSLAYKNPIIGQIPVPIRDSTGKDRPPTKKERHGRWVSALLSDSELTQHWVTLRPNWNAGEFKMGETQKRQFVSRYAEILDCFLYPSSSGLGTDPLQFVLHQIDVCYEELRASEAGLAVSIRKSWVAAKSDRSVTLEGLMEMNERDEKTQVAAVIRTLVELFKDGERRAAGARINVDKVYSYTAVNVDTRFMLEKLIDAAVLLMSDPGTRGATLDRYNISYDSVRKSATTLRLLEVLPTTEEGRAYLADLKSTKTDYYLVNSPVNIDQIMKIIDGFEYDAATDDFEIVKSASIWENSTAPEAMLESLGLALNLKGVKLGAQIYFHFNSSVYLSDCLSNAKVPVGSGYTAKLKAIGAKNADLPKKTATSKADVIVKGILFLISVEEWANQVAKMGEAGKRDANDLIKLAAASNKLLIDSMGLLVAANDIRLVNLTAAVDVATDGTIMATKELQAIKGLSFNQVALKTCIRFLNFYALAASITDLVLNLYKIGTANRNTQIAVHALLASSAALQIAGLVFGGLSRTPHPAAFVAGIVGLFLVAIASGLASKLVITDIAVILGATYFGNVKGEASTKERWAAWHEAGKTAGGFLEGDNRTHNTASTFVRGFDKNSAFEDWERQIAGLLGVMKTYDLRIENSILLSSLEFEGERLMVGYKALPSGADPVKAETVLPIGSRVDLYDATANRPLASKFEDEIVGPDLPVLLSPSSSRINPDASRTAFILFDAMQRVLTIEEPARVFFSPGNPVNLFQDLPGLNPDPLRIEIELTMPVPAWPGAVDAAGTMIPARVLIRKDAP